MIDAKDYPKCIIIVRDKPVSLFPIVFYHYGLSEKLSEYLGCNMRFVLNEFKDGVVLWAAEPEEWKKLGGIAFERLKNEKGFFKFIYDEVVAACEDTVSAGEKSLNAD